MFLKISRLMGCFALLASFLMMGCNGSDSGTSTEGFSGRYHVFLQQGSIVSERTWEINQHGNSATIKDVNILLVVQATVSGQTLSVQPSSVTIDGEAVTFSMTLTFSADGHSFSGTQTTTVSGTTVIVNVTGTKNI